MSGFISHPPIRIVLCLAATVVPAASMRGQALPPRVYGASTALPSGNAWRMARNSTVPTADIAFVGGLAGLAAPPAQDTSRAPAPWGDQLILRTAAGFGLGFLGGLVLSRVGGSDWDGIYRAWMVGYGVGSGLGAAFPNLGSSCPSGDRRLRGLIGSALATLVGMAVFESQSRPIDSSTSLLLLLVPGPVGGALGVLTCEIGVSREP